MLLTQTYNIDCTTKNSQLNLKIGAIRGWFADVLGRTVVCSSQFDLDSGTELQIQIKELLFDDAWLSQVMDDKKSQFTQIDVLDHICDQLFCTTDNLGWQLTTSHYFPLLTLQTLALAAATIHCALSEYARWKKATEILSQDAYWGTFCISPALNITLQTSALINHTIVGCCIPTLWHTSTRIGATQSPLALLSHDWCSSISMCTEFILFEHISAGIGIHWSPLSGVALLYVIPCCIHTPILCTSDTDGSASFPTSAAESGYSLLYFFPCSFCLPFQYFSAGIALSILLCAPQPELTLLYFQLHSIPPISVLLRW